MFESALNFSNLRKSDRRKIEVPLNMPTGYVLDFSNPTIEEFFEDEFNIIFYDKKYAINGTSKAKHLRAIFDSLDSKTLAVLLRKLWSYRSTCPATYHAATPELEEVVQKDFFDVVSKIEGDSVPNNLDVLNRFDQSETLSELICAIERDIKADKQAAALDRLHTYCNKKFRHLIESNGETCNKNEPLHSRAARFATLMEKTGRYSETSIFILRSHIGVLEKFNSTRNYESLAHDNPLLEAREARFVFDAVSSVLRFLKAIDVQSFGE